MASRRFALINQAIQDSQLSDNVPLLDAVNNSFTGNILLGDNDQIHFGNDNDMQIYSNGATGIINTTNSSLVLSTAGAIFFRSPNTQPFRFEGSHTSNRYITIADGSAEPDTDWGYISGVVYLRARAHGADLNLRGENEAGTTKEFLVGDPDALTVSLKQKTLVQNGSVSSPGISFGTDIDSGLYGANSQLLVSIDGVRASVWTSSRFIVDMPILIKEQAAASSTSAAFGQLWVKNTTPNQLWFTRDDGTEVQLS